MSSMILALRLADPEIFWIATPTRLLMRLNSAICTIFSMGLPFRHLGATPTAWCVALTYRRALFDRDRAF